MPQRGGNMHAVRTALVILCLSFSSLVTSDEFYFVKSGTQNFICDAIPLTKFNCTRSLLECSQSCGQTIGCHSYFYDTVNRDCFGSSRVYTNFNGCTATPNVVYYHKESSNQGDTCTSVADCYGANLICMENTCMCQIGYSLQPELNTCEPGCLQYGTTYSMYKNQTLALAGSTVYPNSNIPQCKIECESTGCVTLRFNHAGNDCKTDTRTPYSDPTSLIAFGNIDLFVRNCMPNA